MKKIKNVLIAVLAFCLCFGVVGLTGCGNSQESQAKVKIKFWNPITGPDSTYLQDLVEQFNNENEGEIYVESDPQAEANHYQRILTSFTDNSSADLTLVHQSRLANFKKNNKLRDMTAILEEQGVKSEDYVGSVWEACEFDDKMYAAPYDVLPIVLYYNRDLIPEGYTEEDITNDFTLEKMLDMMKKAYKHSSRDANKVYGISFNYAFTESMFTSFYAQLGGEIVDPAQPTKPLYNNENGIKAAESVRDIALAVDAEGRRVASKSGSDHLNIFSQNRALFTIDGIWSAPDCVSSVNCGTVMLPKVSGGIDRMCSGDGHCFVMFEQANPSAERDAATAKFMKFMIDNSATWCKGGKVAAREDITQDSEYKGLEWAHISNKLDKIIPPVKVYTYDSLTKPIGIYVSKLCEGTETDVAKMLGTAASEGEQAAAAL